MNGVAQHRQQHDLVVVDHLDWIEAGRNPTTPTQWSVLDSLFGSGSSRGTSPATNRLLHNESSRCTFISTGNGGRKKRRFRCRMIQPQDREVIQRLHEEWFPVLYQDEFFDELVQGRMIGSGDPLFTRVAVEDANNNNDDNDPPERIVGCVVGSFVNANLLSKFMQELLVNDIGTHPRLFYIMTLGCVRRVRRTGLASTMVDEILAAVAQDIMCGVVYLHVKIDNVAAIRMYEKLGFYRVTEIENYYSINETLHNCYLYARYFHGNRGHLTITKQVMRILGSFWGQIRVAFTKLRLIRSPDEDERRSR